MPLHSVFIPEKNLGAYGDGGMVVTDDPEIAERIRSLRNYGQSQKYHHDALGYNHRLDTLQAAVLRVKLRHLDEWNQARRDHAAQYANTLANAPVILPKVAPYSEPVWHLYVVLTENRDELAQHLGNKGISTGIHYPIPIHLQTCYQSLPYPKGSFPVTEQYAQEMLSLPMFAELSEDDVSRVGHLVEEFATRQLHPATY
jgi:dTDP-4-amino-4,6-dideoxygalactose transaminase